MAQLNSTQSASTLVIPVRRISEKYRIYKVMSSRWVVVLGAIFIVVFIFTAAAAPLLAPYDPLETDLFSILEQPSRAHLLGTDDLGRDILSRVIYGSRVSLLVGVAIVCIASSVGMLLGLIAGHFSGLINNIVMRFTDTMMSIPPIMLMVALAAMLGGGLRSVLISVSVILTPTYCRLMCSQVLSLKETDYVTAATVIGASDRRIIARHLFPNAIPPLMVLITLNLGASIMFEATLSFLGMGVTPPTPTWGNMIMSGYRYLLSNPLLSLAPGLAIMVVVLSFNMVGDGLRDALDPRLRGTI